MQYRHAPPRSLFRLPAVCLALAIFNLNVGLVLALFAAADIETFFYQPRVLAVAHTFTLGWISLAMIGVLYRYVPALTKHSVRFPWMARVQVGGFVLGALGMVSHFWIGHLSGMAWSAGLLVASVVLLLGTLLPPLLRAPAYDATVIGLAIALLSLLGVATLGLLYAIDKVHPFLGGSVLSNVAAHAHLAVLGWVSLTICAVSYRMVTAFTLPEEVLPEPARRQIIGFSLIVPALVAALLWRSWTVMPLACFTVASLLWYVSIILRLLRRRRMPIDWSMRHVQAAMLHLGAAMLCGLTFVFGVDAGSALGTHLAVAYGVLALLGWVSNFILGMGSRLAPGLTAAPGHSPRRLFAPRIQAAIFWCFNVGVLGIALAVLAELPQVLTAALVLTLCATLIFAQALLVRVGTMLMPRDGQGPHALTG